MAQIGDTGHTVIADEYNGKIEGWCVARTVCVDVWQSDAGTREEDHEIQWDQDLIGPFDTEAQALEHISGTLEKKKTHPDRSFC